MVGIEGLTSAGFYGPKGSGSHENAKDFVANPINAVFVVHDPFVKNNPQCDSMVILTNAYASKYGCFLGTYFVRLHFICEFADCAVP
jgi:hypothetical protein